MTWDRREYEWLLAFLYGCRAFFDERGMIVIDHRGEDITKWAARPPFALVSECPYCDATGLHYLFEPHFENMDTGRPVITRECVCGRQWMECM